MKTLPIITLFTLAAASLSSGQGGPKPVMRDAATHDQLANTLRQAQTADPMRRLEPSQGKDPSTENRPPDLLSRSDMLSYNGMATLVPKGSILVTPPLLSDRIGMKSGLKIVTWVEFYANNRGWINTEEITLPQAEGKVPLSDVAIDKLQKSKNLVVAVLQGGPISKLAPQPAAQPAPETK